MMPAAAARRSAGVRHSVHRSSAVRQAAKVRRNGRAPGLQQERPVRPWLQARQEQPQALRPQVLRASRRSALRARAAAAGQRQLRRPQRQHVPPHQRRAADRRCELAQARATGRRFQPDAGRKRAMPPSGGSAVPADAPLRLPVPARRERGLQRARAQPLPRLRRAKQACASCASPRRPTLIARG